MNSRAADRIASPCIHVCRMNASTGLCDGCFRTIDEIAAWSSADAVQKRGILAEADVRKKTPREVRIGGRFEGTLARPSDSVKATATIVVAPKEQQQ
ncbi:DUF1289 domain-containing protein [Caballeronia sp.]|uniref:DUF1289 domain-containing protein n=1 Tax=Caballeronia sp. TaxID=1931223 RepID=UPI003C41AD60